MEKEKLVICEASAPGKVILHGEHSVVYGKTAIAGSLGIRTSSVIMETVGSNKYCIRINLPDLKLESLMLDFEDIQENLIAKSASVEFTWQTPELIKHEEYLALIEDYFQSFQTKNNYSCSKSQTQTIVTFLYLYTAFIRQAKYDFTPFCLTISSDLTIGSGIGSSASFAVSLTAVLLQYVHLKCSESFSQSGIFRAIRADGAVDLSERGKSLISSWAFCCERISHGNPSGVDNAICTYGSLLEFMKGTEPVFHKFTKDLKICLVNTHVERNTKSLVEKVAQLTKRYPEMLNSIMEACDHLAKTALTIIDNIENETRSDQLNTYFDNLSELFEMNHNILRTMGVSHATLETICSVSKDCGFNSKLTGAGGGGYAIVLIPPIKTEEDVEKLTNTLKERGFDTQVTSLGGNGVTINVSSKP